MNYYTKQHRNLGRMHEIPATLSTWEYLTSNSFPINDNHSMNQDQQNTSSHYLAWAAAMLVHT